VCTVQNATPFICFVISTDELQKWLYYFKKIIIFLFFFNFYFVTWF
jgi:hypothetical protein